MWWDRARKRTRCWLLSNVDDDVGNGWIAATVALPGDYWHSVDCNGLPEPFQWENVKFSLVSVTWTRIFSYFIALHWRIFPSNFVTIIPTICFIFHCTALAGVVPSGSRICYRVGGWERSERCLEFHARSNVTCSNLADMWVRTQKTEFVASLLAKLAGRSSDRARMKKAKRRNRLRSHVSVLKLGAK